MNYNYVRNVLLITLLTIYNLSMFAQMPAAITIEPANATVYDEITLTFDPVEACFMSGSLVGAAYVAMHSGVTINGTQWQNVIEFNGTGANGQSPILTYNPDDTYSITFTPFDFYGFSPGDIVTEICAVFNNGTGWEQDGRDFEPGGTNCMDFFIPIDPGTPPADPFLHSIIPDIGILSETLNVQLFALNTHFQSTTNSAWLQKNETLILFSSLFAVNDTLISAQVTIPGNAEIGDWDVYVENEIDDTLSLSAGFTVNDTTIVYPFAITTDPPEPDPYDEITLTLDAKLSCPAGSIYDADSVMMHSGLTIDGNAWQYVVNFDGAGANGQAPKLSDNGDSTWTIVFTPFDFYGFPVNENVEGINCVFNAGDWAAGEAKDYDQVSGDCIDFYIPLYNPTSILKQNYSSISIFPNPVQNVLKLRYDGVIEQYVIYSSLGQVVISGSSLSTDAISINTSHLQKGLYFIEIHDNVKDIVRKKFIKE